MSYVEELGKKAKKAAQLMNKLGEESMNTGLMCAAEALVKNSAYIMAENKCDVAAAMKNGMKDSLIDRLSLTEDRIIAMADGLRQVAALKSPVGSLISMEKRPNGLNVLKKRVPLGVVGMIYESRPNVTADAFGLCFKTGNAVILKGGSDAINSNKAIVKVIREALDKAFCEKPYDISDAIQLVESTDRECVNEMMKLNEYIDVLIPRGGAGLIKAVVNNSTVPVIETGVGNCHVYVDLSADFEMALNIIDNAKTQRLGVCNACESLVVHSGVAEKFVPLVYERLTKKGIVFRADDRAREICPDMEEAKEEDFAAEYLDKLISLKIVDSIDEAISHINKYNTGHSESIITSSYENSMKFTEEIDAAAVYVNASTRFTDGNEFGFGAEIGISTQKLHARGPMGLEALTTSKYVILGSGQIRK